MQVVAREAVDAEHYTMSASGLVHVAPSATPGAPPDTEFLPLTTWLRELSVYNVMRQMRVFALHRARKSFATWRNHTHAAVFRRARAAIQARLFYAKPAFATLIMDVRRHAHDACSAGLMPFAPPCKVRIPASAPRPPHPAAPDLLSITASCLVGASVVGRALARQQGPRSLRHA